MAYNKEMKYTKRTYRIREDQDLIVKKLSKKLSTKKVEISESQIIRDGIDLMNQKHETINR